MHGDPDDVRALTASVADHPPADLEHAGDVTCASLTSCALVAQSGRYATDELRLF